MADLKPCPFCGGAALLHRTILPAAKFVMCAKCCAQSGHWVFGKNRFAETEAVADMCAIDSWNKRVSDEN